MGKKNEFFFTLLIWIFYYSYELTISGKQLNKNINLNNTSDSRVNKLLCVETEGVDSQHTDFYLKNRFQDYFRDPFNPLKFEDNFENSCDSLASIDYLEDVHEEIK
ncbi:hypothetical protein PMALA_065050 [Plasmodium malariae]|uniref:Uncharacterized protein n=1 Tax=Plasmodium malariae TaxID=5858 RepID=A0A1A8X2G1_PLAMA|nr:hypothetical protein PMALA_065050 [Plasmodium malariae]